MLDRNLRRSLQFMAGAALVTGLMIGAAGSAFAAPPVTVTAERTADVPTRHVSYKGIDIASAKGERMLVGRVRRAASGLCAESGIALSETLEQSACTTRTLDGARPQIAEAVLRAKTNERLAAAGAIKVAVR